MTIAVIEKINSFLDKAYRPESEQLIPEKIWIKRPDLPRGGYWQIRMIRPHTGEVVEKYEFEKMPREFVTRLGGIAVREKYGVEQFKKIGKIGYAVTINKIQDIISNPEKHGLTDDDAYGLARFLKRRLNKTTDAYRNQFSRAWRVGMKQLAEDKPVVFDDPRKKELFNKIQGELFQKDFPKMAEGEQVHEFVGLENKNITNRKQEVIDIKNEIEDFLLGAQFGPMAPKENISETSEPIDVGIGEVVSKQEKIYFQPEKGEKVPEGVEVKEGERGGKYYFSEGKKEKLDFIFEDEDKDLNKVLQSLRVKNYQPQSLGNSFDADTITKLKDNSDSYLSQFERFFDASTFNKARDISYKIISEGGKTEDRLFSPTDLQTLVNKSIDNLVYQEVCAWQTQMSDHGIRHIYGNIDFGDRILKAMSTSGKATSSRKRFLLFVATVLHDMGYTSKIVKESPIPGSKLHPQISQEWFEKEANFYKKFFTDDELEYISYLIRHHDQTDLDWDNAPLLSTLSVSDNLSIFHEEKLPSLFRYVEGALDSLFEMQEALQNNDENGVFKAKKDLEVKINASQLPEFTKSWLRRAANGVSSYTAKFTIPMLIGSIRHFSFSKDSGLGIEIDEDLYDSRIADLFDMGQTAYVKFAKSYGVQLENNDHINFNKSGKRLMTIKINRAKVSLQKSKVYLGEGENPPEGSSEQQGPRGGRFYETADKTIETKFLGEKAFKEFLKLGYNNLLKKKKSKKVQDLLEQLSDQLDFEREVSMGKRNHYNGCQLIGDWVEGRLFRIIGFRVVLAKMRGEEVNRELVRSVIESTSRKPASEESIDLALNFGETSFMSIENNKPSLKPIMEVIKAEKDFSVKKTKELFGNELTLYRGVYGNAAKKIKEQLETLDKAELEQSPLSSYSQDVIAAFAFVHNKDDFIIIKRKVKAEDVQFAWYSNPAIINYFPEQKEVVISPKDDRFTIFKENILWEK